MTPSASASSIVLLAPAGAPAGASTSAETTAGIMPGAAPDGGFQLLVDVAAQQQLAAQLGGNTTKTPTAPVGEGGEVIAEAGNALPPAGLILPSADDQPLTDGQVGKKTESSDKDDSALPATASTTTPPTTIPVPWVPINIQSQPQSQPVAKNPGTHATAEVDATVDTDLDVTKAANVAPALSTAGTAAQAAPAGTDDAATAAAGVGGIQLGVAGMATPAGPSRQSGAARGAQPSFDALANPVVEGTQTGTAADVSSARKGDEVASFVDALKPALAATDATQPAAPTVGAVDTGRAHAPTRSYADIGATASTATVSVPVGSNGWTDAVVDKVMWFSANQMNSAEIKLNPPDLGPLQVRISTQHDQTSVVFSSPHAAVRDALDQALPRLRDMFGGQGLQLSDASVGGQAQRQQQQAGDNGSSPQNRGSSWFGSEDNGDTPVAVTRVVGPRLATSAVDAYA